MNDKQSQKSQKTIKRSSVLENLKDVGGNTSKVLKKDLAQGVSQEFINQLLGRKPEKKYSGDITPGESLEFEDVYSGRREQTMILEKQLTLERNLRQEEKTRSERKSNELKMQLQAVIEEVAALAQNTQELAEEVQIATMQAPIEPGVYHLIFFEKLLEFIKSFRQNIGQAKTWLQSSNKRAQKKNYWANYKKHGGKFLLAADHYVSRSAG
ncbi:hypothetical protein KKH23_01020 [Patescibacteria group bacterium]|nr:hypothetical protein [Patescibacteria group bacterium]MBU0777074.1 hypothetical protein [Patescibacteria group bacterium]MBU0845768.1 hypothetical protein [Patescibacteria group bacterium]MBU0922794.1 hypothetical protein [Patescibacteria group bacterium]MBU1066472.1 hypothetical protein [Patescibacteria group bacterium]